MFSLNPLTQKVMNNKRHKLLFIICFFFFMGESLLADSYWSNHISYSAKIDKIVRNGNIIFALTDGKLFSYNSEDNSFETYIKDRSNTDIRHIAYSDKQKCLLLTRSDANIEMLYEDKSYATIPYLKDYSQNIDKTINSIFIEGDSAYLSTNFGFLIIDIAKKVVRESGVFNFPFHSITSFDGKFYAATSKGVYSIDKKKNLIDFSNWESFPLSTLYAGTENQFKDTQVNQITVFDNQLVFLVPDTAVYYVENLSTVKLLLANNTLNRIETTANSHLFVSGKDNFWDYSSLNQSVKLNIENLTYITPNGNNTLEYWMSSEGNNLCLIKRDDNGAYDFSERWLVPAGPTTNYPFSLTFQNKQLIVTGGGFYSVRYSFGASLSMFKNSRWTNIYPSDISSQAGFNALDIVYAISDPADPDHIFASSWGEGLYEFQGTTLKNRFDNTNSTINYLETSDGWRTTRVSGMVYDKNSNLWILNSMVENVVKIYQKNGVWAEIPFSAISKDNTDTNTKTIIIDKYSNKWICSIVNPYIFIFNDNGTISNTADDKSRIITSFKDQYGNSLEIGAIYDLAEDNAGNIWVATNIGPFTVKSNNILASNADVTLYKVMVAKEDDSNIIVPLLENIPINAIAIDGANRKWIGTETAGVYLVDSQNSTLEHFDIDNSPLPSNSILSLAIDQQTGTVYIGSERGLVSYKSGATQGADNFSNVYAYPNPVKPEYTGAISITGLKQNSTVKITDVRGNLINQGKSLGGQYSWDGLNAKGRRVDTGVYIVFGSSEDGSEGVVTKIMVVN